MEQLNQGRAMLYNFLSGLFARELNAERLSQLTAPESKAFWQQLSSDPALKQAAKLMEQKLQSIAWMQDRDKALLELAADFCGLFLVGSKQSASPYAGLYLQADEDVTLFGEQHQQMLAFLQRSQLQLSGDFPEPADHLAVILAYQAHLCLNASASTQQEFLQECLLSWLEPFCQRVTECDRGGFYAALARLTLAFVQSDAEWLKSAAAH
ncbi:molecular chaperone TorD [Shewanella algae]|uniref:molecular chaperone TorD n=1 Tax=Shewanella algae TaxID=38313 RepID=UPI0031F54715